MTAKNLPLNKRIYADLLTLIQRGELGPGAALPTEKELQEQYGVSRAPVRQALARLENEGHIRRTPGRGTEVLQLQVAPTVKLSGFAHFYNRLVDSITSRILKVETVPADEEIAGHLGLEPGLPVMKVHRVRMVSGEPTAYMTNYFAVPDFSLEFPDTGSEHFTLQQLIRQNFHRDEAEVQEDLVAAIVPPEVGQVLQLPPGTPVLFVTRRGWDSERRPVEVSRYWARSDVTTYRTFLSTK
ncbi:MAG: putative transcriptional regulator of N-Acetylglucosamine utilization, GntR family [Firmicutes bacterium]|nr:putative transcriptional regulator of N-Acetylglucosamine utilization, GntR family [Bacillota bacterium]